MKTIKLKKLTINHFKGIAGFVFDPTGNNSFIFGDNATGKTTIFDSFSWLLFGKDTLNSSVFNIKPMGSNGNGKGIQSSVEGVLSIDDTEKVLKRVYYEKWTKKRGSAHKEFTGHTTDYFIDGVPVKEKEYKACVDDICNEDLVRLLTNPRYFNEYLSWQDRRKLILEVCGDVSDADVIASNSELKDLPGILGKHSIDDYKKIVNSKRKTINKELDVIPTRIDEVTGQKVETRPIKAIQKDIESANIDLESKKENLAMVESGGNATVLTTELRDIENKIRELNGKLADAESAQRRVDNEELEKLGDIVRKAGSSLAGKVEERKRAMSQSENFLSDMQVLHNESEALRKKWYAEDERKFSFSEELKCPECGFDLMGKAKDEAEEKFNTAKADTLLRISESGKKKKEESDLLQKKVDALDENIVSINDQIDTLKTDLEKAESKQTRFRESLTKSSPKSDIPELVQLENDKADIQGKIESAKNNVASAMKSIRDEIITIGLKITNLQTEELQVQANKRIEARVKELSDQERALSAEYEELERHLSLVENFIRTRVSMLEENINSQFKITEWKLFEEQINDGLKECCVATVDRVPYGSLNNAARINVGMDVCNTMSKYYGIRIVTWIDNAESITKTIDTESQLIKLVVSEPDKELRIQ